MQRPISRNRGVAVSREASAWGSKVVAALVAFVMVLALLASIGGTPVQAASSGLPSALSIRVVPSVLPADGGAYPAIYVSLVDSVGSPTLAIANVTVYLTSSTPAVGVTLNSSIVIPIGKGYAMAAFRSTPTVGSTDITATASGLVSAKATARTANLRGYPSSISLSAVPSAVNSTTTSSRSGIVIVEFLDQAGLPAKAIADTPVSVYSSSPTILTLNVTSFTMPAGQLLKVLSFVTRPVPGSTILTASAPQLASGTAQVSVLGRPPLSIKLFVQPVQLITSGTGRLVIALTDSRGNPTRASSNIVVQLRSSNALAITAPSTATISAGNISTSVTLSAGPSPSRSTITVSSSGLTSDFATITITNPVGPPTSLKMYVAPNPVLADNGRYSAVVISLLNSTGYPTVNTQIPYQVTLTSSQNSSVGRFGPSSFSAMSIPANTNYVIWSTLFTSTFVPGTTLLTASAQNLLPDVGRLSTFGPVPSKIVVSSLFPTVPADGASHPSLQVSLADSSGGPAVAPTPVTVYLSSSQTGIAQVSSPITIAPGQSAVVVPVTTTAVGGTANMTAYTNSLSSGYTGASTLLKTVTPSPSAIGAIFIAPVLAPSHSQPGSVMFLQLQDSAGNPAKARLPTQLTITSSNTAVFNKTLQVQIPQGGSYVAVPIVPSQPGTTTFTIISPGLTTAMAQLQALQSPFSAQISASSLVIFSNGTATVTFTMTLDGQGVSGVNVAWTSSGGTVSPTAAKTDPQGQAVTKLTPSGVGVANVNASISTSWSGAMTLGTKIVVGQPPHPPSKSLVATILSFPYYLAIAGVVAIVVIVVILLVRRRGGREGGEGIQEDESGFGYTRLDYSLGGAFN